MNTNRIVKLYKSTGNNDSDEHSWRCNLSRILQSHRSDSQGFMFSANVLSDLNVNENVELLMENNPPVFKIKNEAKQPVDEFVNNLNKKTSGIGKVAKTVGTVATAAYNGISVIANAGSDSTSSTWMPWMRGVDAWSGTSGGMNFEYTFNFSMGQYGLWNAKEEVVKPIINLIAPTIPQHLDAYSMSGPFPNALNLVANMIANADDVSLNNYFSDDTEDGFLKKIQNGFEGFGKLLEDLVLGSYKNFVYEVNFGNMTQFHKVMIENSSFSFGKEVDQDGYPTSGSVTLHFVAMIPLALTSSTTENMSARYGGTQW